MLYLALPDGWRILRSFDWLHLVDDARRLCHDHHPLGHSIHLALRLLLHWYVRRLQIRAWEQRPSSGQAVSRASNLTHIQNISNKDGILGHFQSKFSKHLFKAIKYLKSKK